MILKLLHPISVLLVISFVLITSGCSSFGEKHSSPIIVQQSAIIVEHPRPLSMHSVNFRVLTNSTYDKIRSGEILKNPNFVMICTSVKDYENLALNMSDIKRYIEQQKALIMYYENAITSSQNENKGNQ